MLEVIRENGGIDYIVQLLTRRINGKRGAEFSIAALVSMANVCTANNTIAILTTGRIAKDITSRFGLDPRKSASLLDTFSCMIQGVLPYGAQMLMARASREFRRSASSDGCSTRTRSACSRFSRFCSDTLKSSAEQVNAFTCHAVLEFVHIEGSRCAFFLCTE